MNRRLATQLTGSILLSAGLILLVACGSAEVVPTPVTEMGGEVLSTVEAAPTAVANTDPAGYPPPPAEAAQSGDPYPGGGNPLIIPPTFTPPASYPAMATAEVFQEPRFRIDQPVGVSATAITGQAPPNTPIAILDITYNGAVLGTGRSDESGRFSIPVSGLVGGNRIGLGISELAPGQTLEQMAEAYFPYRGEGFMNIPNLGMYFDTALITP